MGLIDAETTRGEPVRSLLMPAWQPGGHYGVKIVNIAPGNAARGLPGLHSSELLHDAATGVPLALIDGDQITARRTAAASALAASFLARGVACSLLVVDAGRVAALLPEAFRTVRAIDRVTVWARQPEAADALALAWRAQGFQANAAPELAAPGQPPRLDRRLHARKARDRRRLLLWRHAVHRHR